MAGATPEWQEVKDFVVFGPARFVNDHFDILVMTLQYEGQEIDLSGGDTARIRRGSGEPWHHDPTDLSKVEMREVYGMPVPIMTKDELLRYKKILDRPVDRLNK